MRWVFTTTHGVLVLLVAWGLHGGARLGAQERAAFPQRQALPFSHLNGMTGELLFPEMTGPGAALVDYDGDGDLDIYLVQGGVLEAGGERREGAHDVLLRNDASAEGPQWLDVSVEAGLDAGGYGMAVATGDFDGDGWVDLLVGNYGPNRLWRNRGDGGFTDASLALGQLAPRWTTGAAFLDFDGDGREDLYLVNYVDYSLEAAPACYALSSRKDYCGPSGFRSQGDRLLRNSGDGTFADVTSRSAVGSVAGSGLGVAVLDADGDGEIDLYVSNDGQPNFLWRLDRGKWIEDALLAGVAVNGRGEPEAGMGIAVGDYDRDGDEDLLVAHLTGETNTLYVNQGGGLFDDMSNESGLAAPSLPATSFGAAWIDFDHDGWLDLAVVNGAVRIQEAAAARGDAYPLGQNDQLFGNRRGRFVELPQEAFTAETRVGRGLVRGDVDNDGDQDLLVINNAGPAELFLSAGARGGNWLGVSYAQPANQPVMALYGSGEKVLSRATSTGSYASASDPRVLLGGEERPQAVSVVVGRKVIRWVYPAMGRYLRVSR